MERIIHMSTTILICDDSIAVHESLTLYLKESHFDTISVYDGESALEVMQHRSVQLVILDLMLPGKSGIDVLREMKYFTDIPVVCLTAKSDEFDRILGLELGAEDYITKPFYPREVVLKIQKILRRTPLIQKTFSEKINFANLVIDQGAFIAYINNKPLNLTPKELNLLTLFAQHPNMVLTRERILNSVWGHDFYSDSRVVDNHVKNLRQKLPQETLFEIKAIYGIGYKLELK